MLKFYCIVFTIPLCNAASVETTTKSVMPLERRVVGGVAATEGQFPYQVIFHYIIIIKNGLNLIYIQILDVFTSFCA